MNKHPYLRAYLAGIAVPTIFLLVVMSVYTLLRYVYAFPVPIERAIVFPMAVVPNLWGLWNVLYLAMLAGRHFPLGIFGGLLPLLLAPCGYLVAHLVGLVIPPHLRSFAVLGLPVGVVLYYLVWKYLVHYLNEELGIA